MRRTLAEKTKIFITIAALVLVGFNLALAFANWDLLFLLDVGSWDGASRGLYAIVTLIVLVCCAIAADVIGDT